MMFNSPGSNFFVCDVVVTTRIKGLNMAYFKLEVGRISNAFCFAVIMPIICTHVQLKHMKENTDKHKYSVDRIGCMHL